VSPPRDRRCPPAGSLPRGRHSLTREDVAESQRWRLLGAAGEVLVAHGYKGARSREVCRRAGVSSATFYQHFENLDDCLQAAHAVAVDCVWELVCSACEGAGAWPERLAWALEAALAFLASEPHLGRLLCADMAVCVPAITVEREDFLRRLDPLLGGGRELRPAGASELPSGTEAQLLGGLFVLLGDRIVAGEADSLPTCAVELTAILGRPYTAAS
jgi:AcrR family transcriptional regulator